MKTESKDICPEQAIELTQSWLERAVIGLNLCPFAKAVHVRKQIRYAVSKATAPQELCIDLVQELHILASSEPAKLDTTLLIHPFVLIDFFDYNDFLGVADAMIDELDLTGVIQIASFHPRYQFADTGPEDIENHTNRSPFPMLQLLREESMAAAVEAFPDTGEIYNRNIALLQRMGHEGWKRIDVWTPALRAAPKSKSKT
jgi:uncharacterized protein